MFFPVCSNVELLKKSFWMYRGCRWKVFHQTNMNDKSTVFVNFLGYIIFVKRRLLIMSQKFWNFYTQTLYCLWPNFSARQQQRMSKAVSKNGESICLSGLVPFLRRLSLNCLSEWKKADLRWKWRDIAVTRLLTINN